MRHLDWDGCCNVRDLGGLRTVDGRRTRHGALVRADAVDRLSADGWRALEAHGVRTVIDLRNDDERTADASPRPDGLTTVHLPLDGTDDREFWEVWGTGPQFGTPLYYAPHLQRFPERTARVVAAIAGAQPGGVLFHCGIGRDRTGMITLVVLALAEVEPEEIAADYALSPDRVSTLLARLGEDDDRSLIDEYLASRGTTAPEALLRTLEDVDLETTLTAAGLAAGDVRALRARLLEPA